jgi:hypothetical protein
VRSATVFISLIFAYLFFCPIVIAQSKERSRESSKLDKTRFSEDVLKAAELVVSPISVENSSPYSSSKHEIKNPVLDSIRTFRIRLENRTDTEFAFSNSSQQCNCIKMEPQQGVIRVGETFDVVVQIRLSGRVTANEMGSTIYIQKSSGDRHTHLVNLTYSFPEHVGFPVSLVELQVTESELRSPVEFKVPLIFGSEVPIKDIDVIVSKADTPDRPGLEFNIEDGVLHGRLNLSDTSLLKGGSRISFNLIIGRLSNDQIESIPVIVDKIDDLRIFPKYVNFRKQANGGLTAEFFVRSQDSFPGAGSDEWSCSASLDGVDLSLELFPSGKTIAKIVVSLPNDFRAKVHKSKLLNAKIDIVVQVRVGDQVFKSKIVGVVPLENLEDLK